MLLGFKSFIDEPRKKAADIAPATGRLSQSISFPNNSNFFDIFIKIRIKQPKADDVFGSIADCFLLAPIDSSDTGAKI